MRQEYWKEGYSEQDTIMEAHVSFLHVLKDVVFTL